MGKKKTGSPSADKGFASFEDDFFTEGDEGNFLTEDEELGEFQASVEDAPMEDFVPGDEGVPGDDDGVPGDDEVAGDGGVPGDAPVDIAASAEAPVDEDMVATEAGHGADSAPGAETAASAPVVEEPEVAVVGNEDLESVEMTSSEVAREEAESTPPDDVTEVEDDAGEAQKAALAEAARNLPGQSPSEESLAAAPVVGPPAFQPPKDGIEGWLAAIDMMVAEAEHASGSAKAALLSEAARIARIRIGDGPTSLKHAQAAAGAGDGVDVQRQLVRAQSVSGEWEAMKSASEALAALESDAASAGELLQDAALLTRQHLGGGEEVRRLLEASLERNPEDYFSLQLLLEYALPQQEWDLAESALSRMADLAGGSRAAAFHYQRGRILLEHLNRSDDGLEAFRSAHKADRNHVSTTLALQSLYAAASNHEALCSLFEEEGTRLGGGDGQVYFAEAARIARDQLADPTRAVALFNLALAEKESSELRHELQTVLGKAEDFAGLAHELAKEAELAPEEERGWALFRLARAKEASGDLGEALSLYTDIAKNPDAKPASDAVARILHAQKDFKGLLEFWGAQAEQQSDSNIKVSMAFRMGEICEGHLNDQEKAKGYFESILDHAPGYLPALEALERVYTRLEDWKKLAAIYEQRAILCDAPQSIALQIHRAAAVYEFRLSDLGRAKEFYERALAQVADFPPSLDAYLRVLEGEGAWKQMSAALADAAEATEDTNEKVSFFYRSARILADKVGDEPEALVSLRRCTELSPGFLPAHTLLKELVARTGGSSEHLEMQISEARSIDQLERRHWLLMEAAALAESSGNGDPMALVDEILADEPAHAGALQYRESAALAAGDRAAVMALYSEAIQSFDEDVDRVRLATVLMGHQLAAGNLPGALQSATEILNADAPKRPLEYVARLLETHGRPEDAARALEGIGAYREQARLQEQYMEAPEEALAALEKAIEADPDDVSVLLKTLQLCQRMGDQERVSALHFQLAQKSEASSIKVVHGTLAGHLFQAHQRQEDAIAAYQIAFEARPKAGKASEALRGLLSKTGDSEGLRALHKAVGGSNLDLAIDLLSAGEGAAAAELLGSQSDLASRVWREAALEQAGQWQELYDAIKARIAELQDEEQKAIGQGKLRWLLAEKLQGTDEAWEAYTQLHEEFPEDRGILEALARIAGARGDVKLALQYLDGLAGLAQESGEKARIYRSIAEVHQNNDHQDGARQAWLNALEHEPEDREALAGLRSLAEAENDHKAVVGVLAREAALVDGEEQIGLYARIAQIWDGDIGDAAVASEAWRKVMEMDSGNEEAIARLVELTEAQEDWAGFVQYSEARVSQLEAGIEKSALHFRIGLVHLEKLRDEAKAVEFLAQAASGEAPQLDAAKRLEKIYRGRKSWDNVVETLKSQARIEGDHRIEALEQAVKIQLNRLDDRAEAALTYELILEIDPNHSAALGFLSEYRFQAQEIEEAVALFSRREAHAGSWDLEDFDVQIEASLFYYHYALSLIQLDRVEDAKERLNKALDLNPSHLPSLQSVGPLYIESGEWKKAESVYRNLLKYTGGAGDSDLLAETYACLGKIEWALEKRDKARQRFSKALAVQENNITALMGMGEVYYDEEDWSKLLNAYNSVIRFAHDPQSVIQAYLIKGHVLDVKMGLPDKAAQHYQKAKHYQETLSADVRRPGQLERLAELALLKLSELALRENKSDVAKGLIEKALTVSESGANFGAELHLALALSLAGSDKEAAGRALVEAASIDTTLEETLKGKTADDDAVLTELQSRIQGSLR
ncbi:MAG: hypothetical protein VXW32_13130 [Myxococcota bacterium]|nr:hypothetical protein [Myxococcota bacterium]